MKEDKLPELPPIEKLVKALDRRDLVNSEPVSTPKNREVSIRTEICPILKRTFPEKSCEIRILDTTIVCEEYAVERSDEDLRHDCRLLGRLNYTAGSYKFGHYPCPYSKLIH